VYNRMTFAFSLEEAFAGMRISHRRQKEAEPEGHHEDIEHEGAPFALVSVSDGCALREKRLRWIKNDKYVWSHRGIMVYLPVYVFERGCCGYVIGK
jgi:hypothetical protein